MKPRIMTWTGILMSLCHASVASGQDTVAAGDTNKSFPCQVTLVTPMGTNGTHSVRSTNQFSLNIIAGYNGGLEGLEVGGFANLLKNNAFGTQVAGFGNVVMGDLEGIQVAGFGNMVGKKVNGIQVAGFSNHVQKASKVLQVGGFSNQVLGSLTGGQVAGFGNYASDSLTGFQVAGFGNYAGNAGHGIQVSGFMNTVTGRFDGLQVAGFANVAGDVEGIQISGFLNRAGIVNGVQIGIVNLADSFSGGFPVGLISNVKNGYRSFGLGVNELQWITGEFHTGMPLFYSILGLAAAPLPATAGWAYGYGFGSKVVNNPRSKLALEGTVYHVQEGELWSNVNNLLIRLQPKYEYYPAGGRFAVWGGPSANLLISGRWDGRGDAFESKLAPYSFLSDQGTYNNYRCWIGGQLGVKF